MSQVRCKVVIINNHLYITFLWLIWFVYFAIQLLWAPDEMCSFIIQTIDYVNPKNFSSKVCTAYIVCVDIFYLYVRYLTGIF